MPIVEALPSAAQLSLIADATPRRSGLLIGLRRFARHRGAVAGTAIFAVFVLVALTAPLVARHDPLAVEPDARLLAPSLNHLFGTDQLGRDQFSRVVYGARISLMVGIVPVLIAAVTGLCLGLAAGYFRGP